MSGREVTDGEIITLSTRNGMLPCSEMRPESDVSWIDFWKSHHQSLSSLLSSLDRIILYRNIDIQYKQCSSPTGQPL